MLKLRHEYTLIYGLGGRKSILGKGGIWATYWRKCSIYTNTTANDS